MTIHDNIERHECTSVQRGKWIVFSCPLCDYKRYMHLETGEMKVREGDFVLHSGMHYPVGINQNINLN